MSPITAIFGFLIPKSVTKEWLSCCVFSIILVVLGKYNFFAINYLKIIINEVVYRSSYIASVPEKYAAQSYNVIRNHFMLYEDYNIVKEKLKKIKNYTTY